MTCNLTLLFIPVEWTLGIFDLMDVTIGFKLLLLGLLGLNLVAALLIEHFIVPFVVRMYKGRQKKTGSKVTKPYKVMITRNPSSRENLIP